jgi:RimJ/RimL family protein N-acetyltransferase
MGFEALTSERLIIRRLIIGDAVKLSHYRNLPQVSKYQSPWSPERALSLILELRASHPATPGRWFQFGIELSETHELIGDVGFLYADENGKSWIGFTLDPAHWGKGFATEAARAVLDFYSKQDVSGVWASTEPENDHSARVLRRLGFTLIESTPTDLVFCKKLT